MKRLALLFSLVIFTNCGMTEKELNENNLPETFEEAEIWIENQFQPIEINPTTIIFTPTDVEK